MAKRNDSADGRFYEFKDDKRPYVSVTTFLSILGKPFLLPWGAKMERELVRTLLEEGVTTEEILEYMGPKQPYGYQLYTQTKSELGNKVHKAIDYKLKGLKLPKLTKAERKVYENWLRWWDEQGFELRGAEKIIRSKEHGFAGTMDADVINRNGDRLILDWKTGKNHYVEHELQNLAYQWAEWEFDSLLRPAGGLLVYIPEDKPIKTFLVPQANPKNFRPVLAALELWRWANKKPWKEIA